MPRSHSFLLRSTTAYPIPSLAQALFLSRPLCAWLILRFGSLFISSRFTHGHATATAFPLPFLLPSCCHCHYYHALSTLLVGSVNYSKSGVSFRCLRPALYSSAPVPSSFPRPSVVLCQFSDPIDFFLRILIGSPSSVHYCFFSQPPFPHFIFSSSSSNSSSHSDPIPSQLWCSSDLFAPSAIARRLPRLLNCPATR